MQRDGKIKKFDEALRKGLVNTVEDVESYKLSICHPNSAGIDIGSRENYVAIPPSVAKELGVGVVRTFPTTSSGHYECVEYLVDCGVTHVAMESTGHYWQTLRNALEQHGIEVEVVNPRHFRMVPGKKTDVQDCQWLQLLHMYGLLKGSFIPDEEIQMLRTLNRMRGKILDEITKQVNRMQKALVGMNIMLGNVVSDVTGKTGMAIICAILDGERDPFKLAELRDGRCKRSEAEIAEALNGNGRKDLMFELAFAKENYEHQMACLEILDKEIVKMVESLPDAKPLDEDVDPDPKGGDEAPKKKTDRRRAGKNSLRTDVNMEDLLARKTGTRITDLNGFGVSTVLTLLCEVGRDLSRFPDAAHFVAYLGLAPRNKITGGVLLSSKTDRTKHPAAIALKSVVPSLSQTDAPLASFYHSVRGRSGTGKAITAVARKLAIQYYMALSYGVAYVKKGEQLRKENSEKRKLDRFLATAQKLNIPIDYEKMQNCCDAFVQ